MTPEHKPGAMSADEIRRLIDDTFPQVHTGGKVLLIEEVGHRYARIRMKAHEKNLRQGNTISGPAMFQLADFGVYIAILATTGMSALEAVTSNLNINFLTRPEMGDLIAEVRLIKSGRRMVVGEVEMLPEGGGEPVAHAMGTYMLPSKSPEKSR